MRECKRQGWRVVLVTKEKQQHEDWPRESLDNLFTVPNDADADSFIRLVSEIARRVKVDRIVALEEYDVITASLVREHLCIDGMSSGTARRFRDKLAMRVAAQKAGINVPEFVHTLNYEDLHSYMGRVSPPWILKPRADVSAIGIEKLHDAEAFWRALERLDAREKHRERSTHYLLERFVAGDVFHVDALLNNGRVIFAEANCYGRPPMKVAHEGGVFRSFTLRRNSDERKELLRLNRQLIPALGLRCGATHAEFIKGSADGRFYFLEVAARVGGAYIAEVA
ncbi:MAG: ATP-grasp domain-containing protein, partial [Pyrinomonadaceae bacterium]|nr:ATP-grasp domain-containing protein [Pyrinomonadaceae bacterium]